MERNRGRLTGTAKVYRFSLSQMFKGKANRILMVILVLFSLLALPVSTLVTGGRLRNQGVTKISRVLLYNDTRYEIELPGEGKYAELELVVMEGALPEDFGQSLGKTELGVRVTKDAAKGYLIRVVSGPECEVSEEELAEFSDAVRTALEQARYTAMGAGADQREILGKQYQVRTKSAEKYREGPGADLDTRFAVQYIYAILVLILSSFTVSYIVRSVIEEKASRLVELLMVSVRPLALLAGKILAMMTYILVIFGILAAGMGLSWMVSSRYLDVAPILDMLEMVGIGSALQRLDVGTVLAAFVSLILAYLTFSVLSGLSGTCCSSMEEAEAANMQVVIVILAGYIGSMCAIGVSGGAAAALALCPVLSVFAAPAQYLLGTIGFPVLLVSWIIQGSVIALLLGFTARIYDSLLLHRGGRVRLGQMISMAGKRRERR